MHYILKTTLLFVCLFISVFTYGQKAKKILQTIAIDSTILFVDIQQNNDSTEDSGENFYEIGYWEGDSVVIESKINSEAAPVVESSINDYIPLVSEEANRLIIKLHNEGIGKIFVDGELINFHFSYKILVPKRLEK